MQYSRFVNKRILSLFLSPWEFFYFKFKLLYFFPESPWKELFCSLPWSILLIQLFCSTATQQSTLTQSHCPQSTAIKIIFSEPPHILAVCGWWIILWKSSRLYLKCAIKLYQKRLQNSTRQTSILKLKVFIWMLHFFPIWIICYRKNLYFACSKTWVV